MTKSCRQQRLVAIIICNVEHTWSGTGPHHKHSTFTPSRANYVKLQKHTTRTRASFCYDLFQNFLFLQFNMVVRSTISSVVSRLPYSDKIPQAVRSVLDENNNTSANTEAQMVVRSSEEPPTSDFAAVGDIVGSQGPHNNKDIYKDPRIKLLKDDGLCVTESTTLASECGPDSGNSVLMQQYLSEQNAKFDTLINKNLGAVLRQQNQYEEDAGWRTLIVDLAMARSGEEATTNLNSMMGKATRAFKSYIPFKRNEEFCNMTEEQAADSFAAEVFEHVIEPMDKETKLQILARLKLEVGERSSKSYDHLDLPPDAPLVDQLEVLAILWVRLAFIGLRYFIPITQMLFQKFKNNEVLLINNKNFSRFLTALARTMEAAEERLNNNPHSGHENSESHQVVTTQTERVEGYLASRLAPLVDPKPATSPTTWREAATRYAVRKLFGSGPQKANYVADPRYFHYFTLRRKVQETPEETDSDSDDSSKLKSGSVFQIAEAFVKELS